MDPILDCVETALANTSPAVRVWLTALVTAVALLLVMHVGESLGEALYYLTH